tara:strand:- start:10458 stop:12665 length:2208 start_codon:yes stop_codon:yes gene_type:complete
MLRTLRRYKGSDEIPVCPETPKGTSIRLYRAPSPTEQQAKIAADNVAEQWSMFLAERNIPTMLATPTLCVVFVPEGMVFDVDELWSTFLREDLLSLGSLCRSLLPLLNLSKLSARGFSAPEILLVSGGMRTFMCAWFLRTYDLVKERLTNRQHKLGSEDLSEKEREKLQALQDKEIEKYNTHFQRRWKALRKEVDKHQDKLNKQQNKIDKLKKPSGKKYEKLLKELRRLQQQEPFPSSAWSRLNTLAQEEQFNPFCVIDKELRANTAQYKEIVQTSKKFHRKAADQLNHPRGDIFASMLVELLKAANTPDEACLQTIPSMFSTQPFAPPPRKAGDSPKQICFVCGAYMEKDEPSFELRRMIFTSPEQRLQGSPNPKKPKCCISCVTYAYVCGAKPTEDTTIIKIIPKNQQTQHSEGDTQQIGRILINKELNIQSGPYLLLGCKEWLSAKGGFKPVSASVGALAYAYYRIARDVHPAALEHMQFFLVERGQEIPLSNTRLFWLYALLQASGLSIEQQGKLSLPVSQIIRVLLADEYIESQYIAAKHTTLPTSFPMKMEAFWHSLSIIFQKEKDMSTQAENKLSEIELIAGMTGLLIPFINLLKRKLSDKGKKEKEIHREMAKLIENCNDPFLWNYNFASHKEIVFKSAKLFKNSDSYFIYEQTKRLLSNLPQGIDTAEREEVNKEGASLQINFDDVLASYNMYLSDNLNRQQRKELTNKLKLSLYSRFPSVLSRYK